MLFNKLSIRRLKDCRVSYATTSLQLRRNKQITDALVRCFCENIFDVITQGVFWNLPYIKVHTTQTTARWRGSSRRRQHFEGL